MMTSRMRILMVHNSAAFGGAERYTVDLATGLAAVGHEVTLVCSPSDPIANELGESEVEVVGIPLGMTIGWHTILGPLNEPLFWLDLYVNPLRRRFREHLRSLHADNPFDVIHVQFIKERLWVGEVARSVGAPVVWTIHSPLEPWMTSGVAAGVMSKEIPLVDRVIAVSEATKDDLTVRGMSPDRIDVIYNGLDLSWYASGDRQATRSGLNLGEELMVLVPARPHKEKGIDVLIDSAVLLRNRGVATRVFVAGESRHRTRYQQAVQARGVSEIVTFLGHRTDMPDLYAAADIVCLPSFHEGLPYAISEAMAASKPVVATDVGGVSEMVKDGATGVLIPVDEPQSLADALEHLADPMLRQEMGSEARTHAERLFSHETMLLATQEVYRKGIAGRKSAR